jgi:phospholipase C
MGVAAACLLGLLLLVSTELPGHHREANAALPKTLPDGTPEAIHKIEHVVVIMQENRSFDSYFGTYPGADGIPQGVCAPDPVARKCLKPYHDTSNRNAGGPHQFSAARRDMNGGKMNGYVRSARWGRLKSCKEHIDNPGCSLQPKKPDVMGYHDWHEIPNYWKYAHQFVLQDHMFESDTSWSLPAHLFLVSGWSAKCDVAGDPESCHPAVEEPDLPPGAPGKTDDAEPDYAWTDLTYLLHRNNVSWGYYVANGDQPDCENDEMFCAPVPQNATTPSIWNPLPWFDTVREDGELANVQPLTSFYEAAKTGTLPAVSWINPAQAVSEHPPARVTKGQAYVTGLINTIMHSPNHLRWTGRATGYACPGSSSARTRRRATSTIRR